MHYFFRVLNDAPFAYDKYMHLDMLNHLTGFCSMNDGSPNLAFSRTSDYCLMGLSLKILASSSAFKKLNWAWWGASLWLNVFPPMQSPLAVWLRFCLLLKQLCIANQYRSGETVCLWSVWTAYAQLLWLQCCCRARVTLPSWELHRQVHRARKK